MEEWETHEHDWDDCEYCERSYYERDTGYCEYECSLIGCECLPDSCPLCFKYKIEV